MTISELIRHHNLDPIAVMNMLQGEGIVSDNCITPDDIATEDQEKAAHRIERGAAKN